MTTDENDPLKLKAIEITKDIVRLTKRSEDTATHLMEKLLSFGENIIEKTELKGNISQNIQCSKGCYYCCYAQVSVTPPEAILIGDFLRDNYSLNQTDKLLKKIKNNIALTEGKSLEERIIIWDKTPCIFLLNNECSIHSVRPFICRAWHSLSVEQCKTAFEIRDKEAEIDSYPYRNYILGTIREGLSEALKELGCSSESIEIAIAIKAVISHPSAGGSWINGEDIFPENQKDKPKQEL